MRTESNSKQGLSIVFLTALICSGCAGTQRVPDANAPHPLLGLKVRSVDLKVMPPQEVDQAIRAARVLLLGEQHDNPAHHLMQARIIAEQAGPHTQVVFEMLDDPGVVQALNEGKDISGPWNESAWPPYETYAPIFEALFETGAQARAGNPPRAQVKRVAMGGLESLEADHRASLKLGVTLKEEELEAMHVEMVEVHCGHSHPGIAGMVDAQRFKDATMAKVLSDAPERAILIAGTGHVRRDRGVPRFIDERATLSIAFVGVDPDKLKVSDYLSRAPGADILWFTEGVPIIDHCEAFRAHMKAKKEGHSVTPKD